MIQDGVLYNEYYFCRTTIYDWIIIGSEALICIVGCVLAMQIRKIPLPFNEAFHVGFAVYFWAFIKVYILNNTRSSLKSFFTLSTMSLRYSLD
jgi:hypothetical protein